MHCHSGNFVRFRMQSDCCGCCQNKQDGGWQISLLRRKTGWVFANFLEQWLHYKVNNHPITKHKPIYHARNVNQWKGSVEPCPFIGLLILHMINLFIFGHMGSYLLYMYMDTSRKKKADMFFFSCPSYLPFWSYAPLKKSEWNLMNAISYELCMLGFWNFMYWFLMEK